MVSCIHNTFIYYRGLSQMQISFISISHFFHIIHFNAMRRKNILTWKNFYCGHWMTLQCIFIYISFQSLFLHPDIVGCFLPLRRRKIFFHAFFFVNALWIAQDYAFSVIVFSSSHWAFSTWNKMEEDSMHFKRTTREQRKIKTKM